MKPTDEELGQMKEALEIIKAEYRAETDPARCDRLDLAIQYFENMIAGRLHTLAQLRAVYALMDEAEAEESPLTALRLDIGQTTRRLTLRRYVKIPLLWHDLNLMDLSRKERLEIRRIFVAEFLPN